MATRTGWPLASRLAAGLAVLLVGMASWTAWVYLRAAQTREDVALQSLSYGLAQHIVEHWPEIDHGQAGPGAAAGESQAREQVLQMLMAVNPGVQVYVLDAQGRVAAYLGDPSTVQQRQVDLNAVRRFLSGAALPMRGTDPMGGPEQRLFSAAMFKARPGASEAPGYLYVVLDGAARQLEAQRAAGREAFSSAALVGAAGVLVVLALGCYAALRVARPLRSLASRMQAYSGPHAQLAQPRANAAPPARPATQPGTDEVRTLEAAFAHLTCRVEQQAEQEKDQVRQHRDTMAGIAHDLRTPLTALHGELEALQGVASGPLAQSQGLKRALAQSERLRHLTGQLFELATLQAADALHQREPVSLGELVTDAVDKLALPTASGQARLLLEGPAPDRLTVLGDWVLLERALTNLIDNAQRHGGITHPVQVGVQADGQQVRIWVQDQGPGLPAQWAERLRQGLNLRTPPLPRPAGGIGGLGLAIAQRVAHLHGGQLLPLPSAYANTGARLCLALPLAPASV